MAATSANSPGNAPWHDSATERMQSALDELSDSASGSVDRWSEAALDTAERWSDSAADYADRVGDRGAELVEGTRDYIAAHPLRTLGIAAAAGFLIGRMLR